MVLTIQLSPSSSEDAQLKRLVNHSFTFVQTLSTNVANDHPPSSVAPAFLPQANRPLTHATTLSKAPVINPKKEKF